MQSFRIFHYTFDGELLGSAKMEHSKLSPKWISLADGLLTGGPIFNRSLGGPLSRYEIQLTAGVCEFRVDGYKAFSAVLLTASSETKNQSLLEAFSSQLERALLPANACADLPGFMNELKAICERPAFVVINWLNDNVSEQDQGAMFQFAYHLAGSYFRWRDDA